MIEELSKRSEISVDAVGVHVVLTLGGHSVRIDYSTANNLAVLLRGYARIAKANAGDKSTQVIGFANLTDAVMDEIGAQRSRDNTAAFLVR